MLNGYVYELPIVARRILEIDGFVWPTPRACSATAAQITTNTGAFHRFPNLETVIAREVEDSLGTWINPGWIENLMGFPIDYTASKDWVTPKSRCKPQSLGSCSEVSK
jgi:hypothetical protein